MKLSIWLLAGFATIALACASPGGPEPGPEPSKQGNGVKDTISMGQVAKDGKFEFIAKSIKCGVVSVGTDPFEKKAQGQFCVVSLSVKNIGDKAQLFDDNAQYLYDTGGKRYSSDTEASFWINDNDDVFLSEINPGNGIDVQVAFDVPKDVKISRIQLHDSVFSGGVDVTV